ncbi:hypothetical protein Q7P37_006909 [Cladosporium fusiforme]
MASTTNGGLTPPAAAPEPATDASANKRKRDNSEPTLDGTSPSAALSQTQKDIFEVLQKYDTEPSFLRHPFTDAHSTGPAQKKRRQSHSGDEKRFTLSEKLQGAAYSSLAQLKTDAAHVSKELANVIRSQEKDEAQNAGRLTVDDLKRIQRVSALEQLVKEVVDREISRSKEHATQDCAVKAEPSSLANGNSSGVSDIANGRLGTVLTLFGNAPNPRQLFSSMQQSQDDKDPNIKLELPIEEMGLPNGLNATHIMPSGAVDGKNGPTFEEAFPAPYSLPTIHPPKGHKRSAVRDTTLNWEFKDPVSRSSKRGGYTTQSLTTADFLGYGGVDPAYGFYSPQEKRKQRDRALSGGESMQTAPTKAQAEAELQKQEEALFRRAFSSFAPSIDNTKSLVPAQTKAMIWFNKLGDRRFNEVFAEDAALVQGISTAEFALDPALAAPEPKEEDFSKVLEELDSLPHEGFSEPQQDKTDAELVLRQISELLETLASQQRIRNAVIPAPTSASRTPISPAATLAAKIGKPDAPAEDEINTYSKLRHEIAYLALKLPPYAVAKLNGDQLEELGVSKLLPFEARDYQGAMEEDQIARSARQTAAATAAATASLTRPPSSATGQHYSSSSRTPAIGQAANTRYGQSTAVPTRTPGTAPSYQRSSSGQANYGTPSAAPRHSYAQPNQYARPSAPPQQGGYGQPNAQQQQQQQQQYYGQARQQPPAAGYGTYAQTYGQSTPQTQQRPSFSSSQPLQQFQQRSQIAAQNAAAYQNNTNAQAQAQAQVQAQQSPYKRTASPAMQPMYAGSAQQQGQQRPSYANPGGQPQVPQQYGQQPGSGRGTPNFPSQPPTPVNGMPRAQAPIVPRAASGTPNPVQQQQAPAPAQVQQSNGTSFDDVEFPWLLQQPVQQMSYESLDDPIQPLPLLPCPPSQTRLQTEYDNAPLNDPTQPSFLPNDAEIQESARLIDQLFQDQPLFDVNDSADTQPVSDASLENPIFPPPLLSDQASQTQLRLENNDRMQPPFLLGGMDSREPAGILDQFSQNKPSPLEIGVEGTTETQPGNQSEFQESFRLVDEIFRKQPQFGHGATSSRKSHETSSSVLDELFPSQSQSQMEDDAEALPNNPARPKPKFTRRDDKFILNLRAQGASYKEIKIRGGFEHDPKELENRVAYISRCTANRRSAAPKVFGEIDQFLLDMREQGFGFREIKRRGEFKQSVSALASRVRALKRHTEVADQPDQPSPAQELDDNDRLLLNMRDRGLTYKAIMRSGNFTLNESGLRNRAHKLRRGKLGKAKRPPKTVDELMWLDEDQVLPRSQLTMSGAPQAASEQRNYSSDGDPFELQPAMSLGGDYSQPRNQAVLDQPRVGTRQNDPVLDSPSRRDSNLSQRQLSANPKETPAMPLDQQSEIHSQEEPRVDISSQDQPPNPSSLRCDLCGQFYSNDEDAEPHEGCTETTKPRCAVCGRFKSGREGDETHKDCVKRPPEPNARSGTCAICGEYFEKRGDATAHKTCVRKRASTSLQRPLPSLLPRKRRSETEIDVYRKRCGACGEYFEAISASQPHLGCGKALPDASFFTAGDQQAGQSSSREDVVPSASTQRPISPDMASSDHGGGSSASNEARTEDS